jgi:ubiquinone/menaquinone biosynthesis C-methylase UbiE
MSFYTFPELSVVLGWNDMAEGDRLALEWNTAGESWADFVREGKDHYREEMNNPAFFKLIGNVRGKRVLDLACGEGYNTRILARKGARVVGVDFSRKLIELAKQKDMVDRLGIDYCVSDAGDLRTLSSDWFDVVTCSMALMDIEDYEDAVREVARVLKKSGRFVFSITHPCFEWGSTMANGQSLGEWKYEAGTENTPERKALHLEVKRYFGIVRCTTSWTMKRLVAPFKTTSFHRTLTDYFQVLYKNGLLVQRLVEPRPTNVGAQKYPGLRKHKKIPHAVIIEAVKK